MQMNDDFNYKPVRKIGITNRSVSGRVPDFGEYESSLERDFMELLRFEASIDKFVAQPLKIEYIDSEQIRRTYTPDGLIRFTPESEMLPILYEIKYREDYKKDRKKLSPKFRAAKDHCLTIGWKFEVFTEKEIRTQYLENVRFLWPYVERVQSDAMKERILTILWDLDESDPDMLLCILCNDATNRARMIPVIWHFISTGVIGCDLNKPLTMRTIIWPLEDCLI